MWPTKGNSQAADPRHSRAVRAHKAKKLEIELIVDVVADLMRSKGAEARAEWLSLDEVQRYLR